MDFTVQGSNPGGGEIFHTGPSTHSANGYRVILGRVKRPGHGADHPPPSSDEVKERIELYIYSPSGLSWPILG